MSAEHPDIGPELRQLAQALLDRLDPVVRAAAARAAGATGAAGRCQQVWCPVCALAALISGEQHPLLDMISEHSVTLLTVVRSMVAEPREGGSASSGGNSATPAPPEDGDPAPTVNGQARPTQDGRYHHIPIVVETDATASGTAEDGPKRTAEALDTEE